MCGICGELRFDGALPDLAALARISDKLARRGPDHAGSYSDGPLALGHRRLSIIDLTASANQPMVDAALQRELLALSSSPPARLAFALHSLAARGSAAGRSREGGGVAFYREVDVALFREPVAAADSALVRCLESNGAATDLAIAHIRHATWGAVSLANTQSFVRELGRTPVFAHNGDIPGNFRTDALALSAFRRARRIDSEHVFCALLSRLAALWAADRDPPLDARWSVLPAFAADLRALGPANFLYADGDALIAHSHRRLHGASGRVEPAGLCWLQRECAATPPDVDAQAGVSVERAAQSMLLLAGVALSDEAWQALSEGEMFVAACGRRVLDALPGSRPAGRGASGAT